MCYSQDFKKYEPFVVPDPTNSKQMLCRVTNTVLQRIPEKIEKHVSGMKFLRCVVPAVIMYVRAAAH